MTIALSLETQTHELSSGRFKKNSSEKLIQLQRRIASEELRHFAMCICQFQGLNLASLSPIHIINGLFGTHFSLLNVAETYIVFW